MRTFFTALLFFALPGLACAQYRGDVPLGETINFTFNTIGQDGAPITMGGTPEIVVYEEGNTTPITSADALAEDFGSVTGLHNVEITATSGNGFEAGKWYDCVIAGTTPTADSVSIAGRTVGTFRVLAAETVAGLQATDVAGVGGSTAAATTFKEGLNASGVYLTLYVDASAAGDADGRDKTNAYTTINAALAALDGDIGGTIYVAAGTYAENVVVSKSNVTIIGVTGATVNAGTGVSITVNEDNVTLIGMEADATAGTDLSLGAVDGFRARGCTFANAISIGSALDTPDIQYTSVAGTYYPSVATMATAIKAKTDSLTFTVAGEIDANVLSVEGVDATDALEQTANDGLVNNSYLDTQLSAILVADIDDTAGSIGKVLADTLARSPSSAAITNINTVFETDFASAYNATLDRWNSNLLSVEGTAPSAGGLLDAADIEAAADAAIASYFGTAGDGLTGIPGITEIKAVTDKLDTGLEADGATGYQWTTLALENSTGGTGDWTANEKTEIKTVLGITDTGTPDDTPSDGALFVMQGATFNAGTDSLEVIAGVMDSLLTATTNGFNGLSAGVETELLPYFQLLARSDAAIKTDRDTQLTLLNQDEGSGAGSYDSATESAQAIRDRGDAAWITATGFSTLDSSAVQTAATAALDAYDPPTKAEMDTGFNSTLQLNTSYNFTNGSGAEAGATFQIRTP